MVQKAPPESVLRYIDSLRKKYSGLKKVYLFGSFAKGSANSDSDIDLAMVFDEVADTFELQVQLMKIRRQYDTRIEPHIFRLSDFDKTHPLANEIMSYGIEVNF